MLNKHLLLIQLLSFTIFTVAAQTSIPITTRFFPIPTFSFPTNSLGQTIYPEPSIETSTTKQALPSNCPPRTSFPDVEGRGYPTEECVTIHHDDNYYSTCCPYPPAVSGTIPVAYSINDCYLPVCVALAASPQTTEVPSTTGSNSVTDSVPRPTSTNTRNDASTAHYTNSGSLGIFVFAVVLIKRIFVF